MWELVLLAAATSLTPAAAPVVPMEPAVIVVADPVTVAELSTSHISQGVHATVPALATLSRLAVLPGDQLSRYLEQSAADISALLHNPPPASDVTTWWSTLEPSTRDVLAEGAPRVVGGLDGIPFTMRDEANRAVLTDAIRALEDQLASGVGRGMSISTHNELSMLKRIQEALSSDPGDPRRSLVTLDTAWPGRAAIAVGNLMSASHVSYLIPGMFFTIEGQVGDWTDTATELHRDKSEWMDRLGQSSTGDDVATVAWIGYHTPNLLNVGGLDLAEQGATYFTSALEGLQSIRAGDPPHITVVGHSYGSTAAMLALAAHSLEVDAFAMLGSPGSAIQHASELAVRDARVFVGEAAWDPVVDSAFYGSDPGASAFGAHRIAVTGEVDPITATELAESTGHNSYFTPGSTAMRNLALIGIGHGELAVTPADLAGTVVAGGTQ